VDTPEGTTITNPVDGPTVADTAEPWMQLPLRAFLTEEPGLPVAVTLSTSGLDAVLLGRVGTATVELLREGRIVRETDTMLAAPVTDPARQVELLRAALVADVAARQALADTAQQRGSELNQLRASQSSSLDRIRDYVIEQYRNSEFSRDALDAFLSRFDLDPYRPRVKVTYTITGSFEVDSDDADEVEGNVEQNLRVDSDDVDGAVEYSDNFDVTVRSVEPVDD
jgi:hypothetical protein